MTQTIRIDDDTVEVDGARYVREAAPRKGLGEIDEKKPHLQLMGDGHIEKDDMGNYISQGNAAHETPEGRRWLEAVAEYRRTASRPWWPENGQEYWSITRLGISWAKFDGGEFDRFRLATSNCFPTEDAAEAHQESVRRLAEATLAYGGTL